MLLKIEKAYALAKAFVFRTTFRHRGCYSATTTRTSTLFLFYHGNKISSIEERSRWICNVILKQNCRESCSLLHPRDFRNADDWFSFWKWIGFYAFDLRCERLYYILVRFWAINIIDYPFLSTICFNRGRLTWNSNSSPTFDFLHSNTKYTRSTAHPKREIDMQLTWLKLQMHGFLHILLKGEICTYITSHNPLWRSFVYRRKMTAAFLWSLQ